MSELRRRGAGAAAGSGASAANGHGGSPGDAPLLVETSESLPAAARGLVLAGSGQDAPLFVAPEGSGAGGAGVARAVGDYFGSAAALRKLKVVFLPEGYPESVSGEYLEYQLWDTVQAMCSYLRGVLSTQALMRGVGVGDAAATPLAAALQWVLRDGAGMLGQLAFTTAAAPYFGVHLKSWRLFADLINNVGLTLDLLAPLAGADAFLFVASLAQICKAMCGVAAGSTKAALTAHFALRDNMADVQAKEGSQETFVTLLGLLFGMRFAAYANDSALTIWLAFAALTALHCVANYLGVRCLQLPGLNPERMDLLIEAWKGRGVDREAMSVAGVNAREPVLLPLVPGCCRPRGRAGTVRLGVRLAEAGVRTRADLERLLGAGREEPWRYAVCGDGRSAFALLGEGSAPEAQVLAYFEARALQSSARAAAGPGSFAELVVPDDAHAASARSDAERFLADVRAAGWRVDRGISGSGSWRYATSAETGKVD